MRINYDPLDKFLQTDPDALEYLCSFIVHQSMQAHLAGIGLKEVINVHYGYPTHEFTGGDMLENGTYKYPEDPDLYPLCHIETNDEDIYMYEYEMVGIINKETGEKYITRVD